MAGARADAGTMTVARGGSRRPVLTVFHGPPGSGKTTLARGLEAEGVGVRICTDDWQDALGLDLLDDAVHGRLQDLLYLHAMTLLKHGVDVILEDGLWMRAERARVFADARRRSALVHWHVFEVPAPELHRRLRARTAQAGPGAVPISPAELDRILALVEAPGADELAAVDRVTIHRGGPAAG